MSILTLDRLQMKKKLNEYNLAFLDIECTGLDKTKHEIIEIGVLVYNPLKDEIEQEWEVKIAPKHIETADNKAIKINGYVNNPNLYTKDIKSSLIKLNNTICNCIIIGQNIDFDLGFILYNMENFGIAPNFDVKRRLDLTSMVWLEIKDSNIEGTGLNSLCKFFNVCNIGEHGALVDCYRVFEIYHILSYKHDLKKGSKNDA